MGYDVAEMGAFVGTSSMYFKGGQLWKNGDNDCMLFGEYDEPYVTFPANKTKSVKVLNSISEQTTGGAWYAEVNLPIEGMESRILESNFVNKEGAWYASFMRDLNTSIEHPIVNGRKLRGRYAFITLKASEPSNLVTCSINFSNSPLSF